MFMSCLNLCCTIVISATLWTDTDQAALTQARTHCGELYKNSPCVTKFEKREEQVYRATCGRNNDEPKR